MKNRLHRADAENTEDTAMVCSPALRSHRARRAAGSVLGGSGVSAVNTAPLEGQGRAAGAQRMAGTRRCERIPLRLRASALRSTP